MPCHLFAPPLAPQSGVVCKSHINTRAKQHKLFAAIPSIETKRPSASLVSPTPSAERWAYLVGPVRSWQPTALADCNGSTAAQQHRSTAAQQHRSPAAPQPSSTNRPSQPAPR
ncbi:hypothetical protein BOX15_Mlig030798g1 [Macrostomum lignano]|uniref:Uncharacterized protein n=1 Tax=Macrostomum lignano TaxID=282301 RepID=A0A267FE68_9PLAT|nr:hypothetical protein BOX15_Mlig030798g1 [Macrostomum lignano]